jgi:hypothetical protein
MPRLCYGRRLAKALGVTVADLGFLGGTTSRLRRWLQLKGPHFEFAGTARPFYPRAPLTWGRTTV